jgi:hypothetical protein
VARRLGDGHAERGLADAGAALEQDGLVQLQAPEHAHDVLGGGGRLQGEVQLGRHRVRALLDGERAAREAEPVAALDPVLVPGVVLLLLLVVSLDDALREEHVLVQARTLLGGQLREKEFEALLLHPGVLVDAHHGGRWLRRRRRGRRRSDAQAGGRTVGEAVEQDQAR